MVSKLVLSPSWSSLVLISLLGSFSGCGRAHSETTAPFNSASPPANNQTDDSIEPAVAPAVQLDAQLKCFAPVGNSVSDKFKAFSGYEGGKAFLGQYLALQQAYGLNTPSNILPSTDASYARLQTIVNKVFRVFQCRYPALANGLTTPPTVLVVESNEINAFALGDVRSDHRIPYLFVVYTGLASNTNSDDEYLAVVAHELTHLLMGHSRPGMKDKIARFYMATTEAEPLGFLQRNDPDLKTFMQNWITRAKQPLGASITEIAAKYEPTLVRYYSFEEQADDFAILTLRDLGLNTDALGDMFLHVQMNDTEKSHCLNFIQGKTVPPYGSLIDPHHGDCYRVFHSRAYAQHLKQKTLRE
ncbi:MAG: M48 family metalloprotease [Bdellovibrionales bacterium]|nr:M48 family metalloprotease [Bdellovibrionales bacterium]